MMRDQPIAVTVDAVIFCKEEEELHVVLVQRKNEPFKYKWALPGGFLEADEALEEGAARELKEETGLKISNFTQIGVFGTPGRDPRGRVISIAFMSKTEIMEDLVPGDDAQSVDWFNTDRLPSLAFDHLEIIERAKGEFLKRG
jgi:8-oxo-dGTP diphosphatase